jgi:hypothetical protein
VIISIINYYLITELFFIKAKISSNIEKFIETQVIITHEIVIQGNDILVDDKLIIFKHKDFKLIYSSISNKIQKQHQNSRCYTEQIKCQI